MAKAFIDDTNLTAIADAIRAKNGSTDTYLPSAMPAAIEAIPTGIDTSDATATESDIITDTTAYVNGEKITGTMQPARASFIFSTSSTPISVNGWTQDVYISADALAENTYVPAGDNAYITIPSSRRREVLGNAQASEVLAGKTFISNSNIGSSWTTMIGTGTMPSKDATTYTPTTTDQTIDAGQYLSGAQTIQGDANLVSENIASGISIFGVTGTHVSGTDTSDADATSIDIINGKTAYVNGTKLTGTLVVQNFYTGTEDPDDSIGINGDLYLKVSG